MKPSSPNLSLACFGEVLWDCLPSGRLLGGAPLNVAYHAAKLGARAAVISSVGDDDLGAEALERMARAGVSAEHVGRHATLPTGTVQVTLSASGQPTFSIAHPVAWDEIPVDAATLSAVRAANAIVYGSLAARSEANRRALDEILRLSGPQRVFDVNLRPPFDEKDLVLDLARCADIVKLNDAELSQLSGTPVDARDGFDRLQPGIEAFLRIVGSRTICITCGSLGAALWHRGAFCAAAAPRVNVVDTVGAGDAFTAALTLRLLADASPDGIQEALERACALGALVCSLPGAQPEY